MFETSRILQIQKSSLELSNGRCPGCDISNPLRPCKQGLYPFGNNVLFYRSLNGSFFIHIGVGSDVVCSSGLGNARALTRGTDNRTTHAFFVSVYQVKSLTRIIIHCGSTEQNISI